MKLGDAASGVLSAILGLAVVLHARTFPPMPGQPVGPSLFPMLIGAGLLVAGLALILGAGRRPPSAVRGPLSELVEFDSWTRRPRMLTNFVLVIADLLFYALTVDRLGFLITAILFLTVLFLAFGVRRRGILPLALAVTFAIHYVFYTLLRVPLPWGVLREIAW
jgi:putative tricarboxylic transport membrane protein